MEQLINDNIGQINTYIIAASILFAAVYLYLIVCDLKCFWRKGSPTDNRKVSFFLHCILFFLFSYALFVPALWLVMDGYVPVNRILLPIGVLVLIDIALQLSKRFDLFLFQILSCLLLLPCTLFFYKCTGFSVYTILCAILMFANTQNFFLPEKE